ncbi:hypothetical protein [Paenibacillus sp. QZ-Y1]|uniref:hypothetical protein n=1 Tax=Paenibacillus sp. QZ-Y1 TaxID=3414511 RepID=UPI003F7ABC21
MEHQTIDTTSHETLLASLEEQFSPCADVVIQTFPAKDEADLSVIMVYCEGLADNCCSFSETVISPAV